MSSLKQPPKFLLDENVRRDLYRFLTGEGNDVKQVPKSATDSEVAAISKREERVLVTNDQDFCDCGMGEVFAVVWLRVPQSDPAVLIKSFGKLLRSIKDFSGKLIILKVSTWVESQLAEDSEL